MNETFFLRTFFHSTFAILESRFYIVVEQFGAENISLLSGRLVSIFKRVEFTLSMFLMFCLFIFSFGFVFKVVSLLWLQLYRCFPEIQFSFSSGLVLASEKHVSTTFYICCLLLAFTEDAFLLGSDLST